MLRRKNGQIQTPIVRLRNNNTNQYVFLIGTCHIAEPQYYEELQNRIDIYENNDYKILYERVKDDIEKNIIDEIIEKDTTSTQLNDLMDIYNHLCELMNLQFQGDGIKIKENWINTDLTTSELNKLLNNKKTEIFPKNVDFNKFKIIIEKNKNLVKWIFNKILGIIPLIPEFDSIKNIFSKQYKILVNYRNKIAVDGIKEHIKNNVVSIWGAGHINGIVKLLNKEGFNIYDIEWITCYNVKKYKLLGE